MSLLPWTVYLSFAGVLLTLVAGRHSAAAARIVALVTTVSGFALGLVAATRFTPRAGLETIVDVGWISQLGIRYHLAVDGISLSLVLLTGLAATAGVLFSWNIERRVGEFFALYLALIGGVYGVFLSADGFLLFVFYEIAIVPKYFLIAYWGSTRRTYAAMKLAIYSFGGSALVLAGLLWAYASGGGEGFALEELARAGARLSHGEVVAVFGLVFFGFATLAGIFPLHTWAPTGHVAAPTAASMLLAGVVMKLGAYGCLRVAMPLFPAGFAVWQPVIGWLAVIGIVYAGLIALVQGDFKFVIGYSSVSHMGFVMLGLAAANLRSLGGAVLQMISHGVIAGLLFAVVGRMVYERMHTRELVELRRWPLFRLMPFAAFVFVVAAFASMGMPGFSGFPAELGILIGAWGFSPRWALVAAVGVIVTGAFTLRVLQEAFFGGHSGRYPGHVPGVASVDGLAKPNEGPAPSDTKMAPSSVEGQGTHLLPISVAEKVGALLLIAATVFVGLNPDVLLDWIVPSLQSPLMQGVLTKGAP